MVSPAAAALPPVLLVLDAGVLVTSGQPDWQRYNTVGICVLPQAVVNEMQTLLMHAPDPDLERVAREFHRFQVRQQWQSTEMIATHPVLKARDGHAISKKARLSLAVAKCAYGLAKRYPQRLVVLATTEHPQIQRLQVLQLPNLCGVTGVGLRGWAQSGQRPIAVVQHWQQMKTMGLSDSTSSLRLPASGHIDDFNPDQDGALHTGLSHPPMGKASSARATPAARVATATPPPRPAAASRSANRPRRSRHPRPNRATPNQRFSNGPGMVSQVISLMSTMIVLAGVGWIAWQLFNPAQLQKLAPSGSPTEMVQ